MSKVTEKKIKRKNSTSGSREDNNRLVSNDKLQRKMLLDMMMLICNKAREEEDLPKLVRSLPTGQPSRCSSPWSELGRRSSHEADAGVIHDDGAEIIPRVTIIHAVVLLPGAAAGAAGHRPEGGPLQDPHRRRLQRARVPGVRHEVQRRRQVVLGLHVAAIVLVQSLPQWPAHGRVAEHGHPVRLPLVLRRRCRRGRDAEADGAVLAAQLEGRQHELLVDGGRGGRRQVGGRHRSGGHRELLGPLMNLLHVLGVRP
uniref:Uncharacterized protein n=1 Tax=Triticum urartu TaxID=4572 RepID=A0A8R7RBE6_TRIUA